MEEKNIKKIKTGYTDLDEIINIQGNNLIVLGSRICMGKSTFALNILRNIAIEQKMPALYFNLEWSKEMIISKLATNYLMIKYSDVLKDKQYEKNFSREILKEAKIYIEDKPGISISEICQIARKMKQEQDIKFILIDYLQLVKYDGDKILRKK